MTYFLIYTEDKADSLHIRMETRKEHLAWISSKSSVKLKSAGPWVDENGDMRGSLIIAEGPDLKTVEDWIAQDPYNKAGLTGFKRVREFNWAIGAPG